MKRLEDDHGVDAQTHVVFIFLDGVGIGPPDPHVNPFLRASAGALRDLVGTGWPVVEEQAELGLWWRGHRARLYAADASLGVSGLPQSGTGTTSLLTGVNAARLLGRHEGPFPPSPLHPVLRERNLFARVRSLGGTVTLANAFPPSYLERLARGRARRTTMTRAALAAGVRLRGARELERGLALSAFVTNERWNRVAPSIPVISPQEAGARLARLARAHTLTAFEFFQTDHAGHRQEMAWAIRVIEVVNGLLTGLLAHVDPERTLVIVASDHGNCEDLSTNKHTLNPVPILTWGRIDPHAPEMRRLTDVVPFVLHHVGAPAGGHKKAPDQDRGPS
ncbi:MAG: peptidase [Ardenticatenia bacterium]|nr:peptidase [Ardenticatenia bacterium]